MEKILGIFGYPISHSLSSHMHNAVCQELNLPYTYKPFEIKPEDLEQAIKNIRTSEIVGVNITIPHKENVIKYLDEISSEAKLIGAVNTIKNNNGELIGHNTDGQGFVSGLKEDLKITPAEKKILILGSGGGARGIAITLALSGAKKIIIANRTLERAKNLCLHIKRNFNSLEALAIQLDSKNIGNVIKDVDVLINTTSCGMKKDDVLLFNPDLLSDKLAVVDIIYNPKETILLKEAKKRNARIANGISMLVYQGALAFEIWTGIKPSIATMRNALMKAFG